MSNKTDLAQVRRDDMNPKTKLWVDMACGCVNINYKDCCVYKLLSVHPAFKEYWETKCGGHANGLVHFSSDVTDQELKYFNDSCAVLCGACQRIRKLSK